jgi:hypothetical protein
LTSRRWRQRLAQRLCGWLLAAPALACAATTAAAAATVSGPISVNTVWRVQDGPFDVSGDITVQGGATLTIEAGTQVYLRAGASLIVQQGALRISGTPAAPVLLTSQRDQGGDTPAPGDWGQLRFLDGTSDAGTLVEHAIVRFGAGVLIERASPTFNHLRIERNAGPAISMDLASSPSGVGLSAQANALDGILVPAGEVRDDIVWGLVGIPYVVASGVVSVGAAPTVIGIAPDRIEQGETITATVSGTRLADAESVSFSAAGLSGSVLPGGGDTSVSLQISADPATPLGNAAFEIQTAAGRAAFAPGLAVVPPLPPISVTGIDPTSIRRGESLPFTVTGSRLQGAAVTSSNPGLAISALQTTPSQASFTLTASQSAALGPALLSFSNPGVAKGIASIEVQVNKALPKVIVTPAVLAIPPDGTSRQFRVGLTESDDVDRAFTLSVGDTTVATVTPETFTIPAGQTQQTVSVRGLKLGQTTLSVNAAGLASLTLPIYVTPDFSSINTAYARLVTVQRAAPPAPPVQRSVTPLLSRAVTLGARRHVRSVSPSTLTVGTGPVELVLSGIGLEGVSAVSVRPGDGLTLGTVSAAPDGTSVRVLVTVASDAPLGARQLVLAGMHQPYQFVGTSDRVLVVPPAPQVASISPIAVTRGASAVAFTVRGQNLQNLQSLAVTPAAGITIGVATVSADGTTITTALSIASDAALGDRLVTVTTPAGTSSATPTPANTLHVVADLGPQVSPLLSATAQVLRQFPRETPTRAVGLQSREARLAKGSVATRVTPPAGSIGETLTVTISGSGLQSVSEVRLEPADGVTLGTPAPAPDGLTVSVSATIAGDAPRTIRRVRIFAGAVEIPFADARAAQFRVTTPQPQIVGIAPINIEAGAAPVALRLIGRNLQNAERVRVVPPEGIGISAPPSVNADGTEATVNISAAPDAALGTRVVVIATPAGETSEIGTPANTLTVARTLGPTLTPIVSRNVNVLRQVPARPIEISVGPNLSREVRVARESGAPPPVSSQHFVVSRAATVAKGAAATAVTPPGLLRGSSASLVVSGYGLGGVTSVSVAPADGVSITAPIEVAADGTQVTAQVTAAADAAPGPRTVRLGTAGGDVAFVRQGAARLVVGDAPSIESISPIVARRGEVITLLIRGQNLRGALSVTAEPAEGLAFEPNPAVNAAGTELTLRVQVALDAALGARAIRVTTALGASPAQAQPNNTLTIFP